MKKVLFFFAALLMGVSVWAQTNPPADVTATALSNSKAKITWNVPVGATQPARLDLWNQAIMVNQPGAGYNGADVSAMYGGQALYGVNANANSHFWLADDFTLAGAAQVREIEFYTYQTGSSSTSTITGCYVSIYDTEPLDSTAVPVWTSNTTSCMTSTSWTGIYRTTATALTDTTRPIMRVVAGINTTLPAGNYWVAVCFTGSLSSGPWASPIADYNQVSTGNAIQYLPGEGAWGPWEDRSVNSSTGAISGSLEQMGMPFVVRGEFVADNLRGFNVYRDNNQINTALIEGFSYIDANLEEETEYCYSVEAVYTSGSPAMSDVVCATTLHNPCRITSMPYNESFDSYGTTSYVSYPTCWTKINTTTSTLTTTQSYPYISSTNHSAPGSLYMYTSSAFYIIAITPLIDSNTIAINTLRAKMMLYKSSAAYNLVVGTIVDPTDPSTFEPYDTLSPTATSSWQPFTVDFNHYTGNAHYIALRSGSGSAANTIYVDDFTLDYIPSCDVPSSLSVSNITSNSITLSWTPTTPASSWDIQYQMEDDEDWTEVYGITETSYTFENLEANTQYSINFKIKAICADDDESTWLTETFNVRTSCLPVTEFPYTESFDTYGTGTSAYPNCWSKSHTQTTTSVTYPYINTTYNTAPGAMYFYSTSSYGVWAVTPYIDANINTLQADFKLRKASAAYKLAVGVISDPEDLSTFVGIDTLTPSTTSVFEPFSVVFNSYQGTGHYIAFVSNFNTTNGMYMDDLVIGVIQTCLAPTTISLEEATISSATVVWNSTDEFASYDLRYRMVGEEDWTTVLGIGDTTYLLENLNSSSRYELQIRTICAEAESYWSELLYFQTMCSSVTELPYFEGFETYGSSTGGSEYPTCWTRPVSYVSGSNTAPFCNSAQHHSGAASLRFSYGAWAATPQFEEDIHNMQVSFWLRMENANNSGNLQVGVMSNPADTSTFELVESFHPSATATWFYHEVNFNNTQLTGTNKVIAFRQMNYSGNYWYWIDDVDVHYIPTCIYPSNLASSNVTQNSVTLSWHDDNNASSFTVRYRVLGAEEWTEETVYDTTTTLTSLLASSAYEWQVKTHCSETDESVWSITTGTFTTECGAISSLPYYETFDVYGTGYSGFPNVAYPTCWSKFNNTTATATSTQSYPYCNSSNNYSAPAALYMYSGTNYYTMAMLPPIDSLMGVDVNQLQISFMGYKTSAAYNVMIGVMTDPTDASTFVPLDTVSPSATSTYELFEIPLSNYQGTGRYITFRCGTGTATNGFYIDNVMVDYIPTCFRPTDVYASVSTETATISWSSNGNESEWVLNYMAEDDEEWTEISGIYDNSYELTSLDANSTYLVKVKALCNDGQESEYSVEKSFTTLCYPLDTLPYRENFDSYASGTAYFPDCWVRKTNYTTNYPYIYSSYYVSPSRSLYFYASTTTYCYAALPALPEDVNMQEVQVSFKARKTSAAYQLEVGVMTDPYDLSTYTVVQTISPTTTTTSEDFTVYMNSYTGPGKHIVFKTPDGLSTYMYLDDVEIDYAPECLLPTNVSVTNITSSEATVHWGAAENETEWQIVYGPTGFSIDEVEPISITVNPYTLTDLEPNTSYDVYLRTICSNGDISVYSPVTTFTTGCAPLALPYSENFDNYNTGTTAYPVCWQKINNNNSYPYISSMTTSTGLTVPGALYFSTTSTTYAYAILPEFDAELNTLQMSFAFKAAMGNGYFLEVGVLEDLSDTSSFVLIQTIEPRTAVWNSFTVAFTGYEGTGKYIAIRSQRAGASNVCYMDNVVVNYAPGCVAPMHLEAENITTTTADLTWRAGRDESEWIVAYGPKNFNPNVTGVSQTTMANPLTITNLEPGTFYDFYVKAVCDASDNSEWSMKGSFRTDCLLIDSLPYAESFDTYGTGTTAFPNCWNRNTTYSTTTQYPYINTTNNSAPGSLYFYSTSTTYNYVTLPEIDESLDISLLRLSFKLKKGSAAYHLDVGVMTNPDAKNTFVKLARVSPSTTTSWESFEVEFYNYTGEGRFIAFASDTNATNYLYLDDVVLDYAPTCHEVTNITINDVTTDQADISWTPVFEGVSWDVEYGPTGFEQGSAAGTTVNVTDTFVVLTGLNNSTTYDVYVKQICADDDESPWSEAVSFSTTMVPVNLPYTADFSNPNDAWVLNNGSCANYWKRGTVNNDAALFVTNNGTTPGYENSISVVSAQKLFTVGTNDSITIIYDVMVDGETSYDYMKMFLAPATEEFPASTSAPATGTYGINSYSTYAYDFYTNSYGTQSSYHYILNKLTDTVHIQAVMPNPNTNPNSNSTALLVFAWKNDGTVNYPPAAIIKNLTVTCNNCQIAVDPTVTTETASGIAQTTATLNATINNPDDVAITAKGFEWKLTNGGTYTQITGTGTGNTFNASLNGLIANTNYTYKAYISYGETTVYGEEVQFTTLEEEQQPCNEPTDLTATATAYNTADVSWNAGGSETAWTLQYKTASAADWNNVSLTVTNYQLTLLTAETEYQVRVLANCADGITSDWVTASFTTPTAPVEPCNAPTGLHVSNITQTTATMSWNAGGEETSWKIGYKLQSESSWQEATVNTTSYNIEGLTANSTYDVRVKAICAADNESEFVTASFTTEPVGIDNITLANSISLMPNPADNYIELRVNSNVEINEAVIFNAFGQMIQTVQLTDNQARIDLSDMAAGMYFVRVNGDNVTATKKFIRK